jgi:DNA-binding SARP family transcriptional activator
VLEFRILGPLEVVDGGGPIRLGGPKQRATLAILLLNANRVVSVDRLADDLYAGAAPVTAVTQVQRQISELRKALGAASAIETRGPGYVIRLSPEQLDLNRFEALCEEAGRAAERGDARAAAERLREALALWRGAPLADLAYESFAQTAVERLEDIRLAAVEQRIDAELALGRHAELVGELEELVAENPLRESLHGQLMLALYRSGRQAEALDAYRRTRETLVETLGIEPTRTLHELERAILAQDPALDFHRAAPVRVGTVELDGVVLVLPSQDDRLDILLAVAEPLVMAPPRELIIARLVEDERDVAPAASAVNERRRSLQVTSRTAAFTTTDRARDVTRLATTHGADLVLLDAPPGLENGLPDDLAEILARSPADVAVLKGIADLQETGGVFVPFGGGDHDWAALELAAWLSSAGGRSLRLVGRKADPARGQRDASRLLADASLAVQRIVGVDAEPVLAESAEDALVAAVEPATLVVVGISPHWRRDGIGASRQALVRHARPPILIVHRGPRPGGLAPREARTRFTWSIER